MAVLRTAAKSGLVACRSCDLLCRLPQEGGGGRALKCPRCGSKLRSRKPASVSRTWALVIAALILYLPANLLPITRTTSLGQAQEDTIISGVIYFLQTGSLFVALVIFTASVVVPLAKLVILSFLLLSVQGGWRSARHDRTRLYRLTELIGRWSMVDVYVVTILVALVQLGGVASVRAGPGAAYFAAVVIVTMFAAQSFDPRLIWDAAEERG